MIRSLVSVVVSSVVLGGAPYERAQLPPTMMGIIPTYVEEEDNVSVILYNDSTLHLASRDNVKIRTVDPDYIRPFVGEDFPIDLHLLIDTSKSMIDTQYTFFPSLVAQLVPTFFPTGGNIGLTKLTGEDFDCYNHLLSLTDDFLDFEAAVADISFSEDISTGAQDALIGILNIVTLDEWPAEDNRLQLVLLISKALTFSKQNLVSAAKLNPYDSKSAQTSCAGMAMPPFSLFSDPISSPTRKFVGVYLLTDNVDQSVINEAEYYWKWALDKIFPSSSDYLFSTDVDMSLQSYINRAQHFMRKSLDPLANGYYNFTSDQ